ncbi:mediator of DNA damage checkpoint protein 1 [Dendropsophus ebraccatus]|uniref:mediator of DNA damage checkpoint protein 1 n=1 Tax=Dendropsophus ebraccatus TaxID=150705 RepID=UPI00383170BF
MDQTQRLSDVEEEQERSFNRDEPVGNLHMFAGEHGPARDFPIFYGENVIGRHTNCDITLPAQSVSKKHAILEVKGNCHTILDNGSLNKTRRSKAALTPHIRYFLTDGDFLHFADVVCRYTVKAKVEEETSEDDSMMVPPTQGALAIEKTPGAAIRRIAQGTVLARDSGDEEDEEEEKPMRRNDGVRSFRSCLNTSGSGDIFPPDADTIVPESDEEDDTSTSETRLPSLSVPSDSDTDTSRRSAYVPPSPDISTSVVHKDQPKHSGEMLPPIDKEAIETSRKSSDAEMKLGLGAKENREQAAESTSGGSMPEPGAERVDTEDGVKEQECAKLLQDDALQKPSSESVVVSGPRDEDHLASTRSETVQEAPCESSPSVQAEQDSRSNEKEGFHLDSDTDVEEEVASTKVKEAEPGASTVSGEEAKDAFNLDSDTDVDKDVSTEVVKEPEPEQDSSKVSGEEGKEALNLDSDTDVEEDVSTEVVKEPEPESSRVSGDEAKEVHNLDSDTDVEEDVSTEVVKEPEPEQDSPKVSGKEAKDALNPDTDIDVEKDASNAEVKEAEPVSSKVSGEEAKEALSLDSDTDVEEDASTRVVKEAQPESSRVSGEEAKDAFNLDSDTDVEEDSSTAEVKEAEPESSKVTCHTETKDAPNLDSDTDVEDVSTRVVKEAEPGSSKVGQAETKDAFNLDSDTDVDEDVDASSKDVTCAPQETTASTGAQETTGVDSDTDVDEDQKPGGSDITQVKNVTDEPNEETAVSDTEAKEAAALHVDSDTDVDDDDDAAPESTTDTHDASKGTEVTKAAEWHVDGDTDVVESKAEEDIVGTSVGQEEGGVDQKSDAVSGISTEQTKNVPAQITEEDAETQKSESESNDLEMMPTQCYLEEESELQDDEEATQAFIFSSTWTEPDPFKRPANPIDVLQISSVTVNTSASEEESDDDAFAATQAYCSETEPRGPSVLETPEPVEETIQPSSSGEESGKEVQEVSNEAVSQDATQPVSQCLSAGPPQEAGTWLHLKRDVPASVWIKEIQQEGDSKDLEGDSKDLEGSKETAEDSTQPYEQSLNLELEATQSYLVESPSLLKPPVQTETPAVPCAEDNTEPVPSEKTEQPCSEDTQASAADATQQYSLGVPGIDGGTSQAPALSEETTSDGATNAESIHTVTKEEDDTQGATPSVPAAEVVVPETSAKSKAKPPPRRGLSRSKRKVEPAEKVPETLSSETPVSLKGIERDSAEKETDSRPETKAETNGSTSEALQAPQEESRGRKATLKSRVKPIKQESDEGEDTATAENKKAEEAGPASLDSGKAKTRTRRTLKEEVENESKNVQEDNSKTRRSAGIKEETGAKRKEEGNEDVPESSKRPKRTRSNSKENTAKPEQEVKDNGTTEENKAVRKTTRAQRNRKDQEIPEDNTNTQDTFSSAQTSIRTRRQSRGDDKMVKETVEETTPRRTRQDQKEEAAKLEDQTKKPRRTRKDSKTETKTEESVLEDKEEKVVKSTRKTRKSIKEEEAISLPEIETKEAEQKKTDRLSRTRAKVHDESKESHDEVEAANKGDEESHSVSPQDGTSKPAGGRGRRAAKKDIPQASPVVESKKRGQVGMKRTKLYEREDEAISVPKKETKQAEQKKTDRLSRTRAKVHDDTKESHDEVETANKGAEDSQSVSPQEGTSKPAGGRGRRAAKKDIPQASPVVESRKRGQVAKAEVEIKRTKLDEREDEEQLVETPRRRGRPRKQTQNTQTKILFTGVVDSEGEEIIRELGGEIAQSVYDCTHVVTDRVRRTVKFLCALARGIPIVTLDWLDKSKKSRYFLSPIPFLVNDQEQEKNFNFSLSDSLQKAKESPLLQGYAIHVTKNVSPTPKEMKDIIVCSGATFLPKMPRAFKEKCVVVSCAQDLAACTTVPVPVTSAEFILSGILRQEVNPAAYLLTSADSGHTPAKRRR